MYVCMYVLQVAERLEYLEHHDHEGEISELELKCFVASGVFRLIILEGAI